MGFIETFSLSSKHTCAVSPLISFARNHVSCLSFGNVEPTSQAFCSVDVKFRKMFCCANITPIWDIVQPASLQIV